MIWGQKYRSWKILLDIKSFTNPNDLPASLRPEMLDNLPDRYKVLSRVYYLLFLDKELIGWAQVFFHNQNEHELAHVNIAEEHQGKGLGEKFVKFIVFNSASPSLLLTTVIPDFFIKVGFARMGTLPSFVDHSDYDCQHCEPEKCTPMIFVKPSYLKKFGDCPICQARYTKLVNESKPMICEYSLTNNKMWSFVENPYFIDLDDHLFIVVFPFEHELYGVILPYRSIQQKTLDKFLLLCDELGINKLKVLTNVILQRNQDLAKFQLIEDRGNWDYLYKVSDFANYTGANYEKKRNRLKKFLKSFPQHEVFGYPDNSNHELQNQLLSFAKPICKEVQQLPEIYSTTVIEHGLKNGLLEGIIVKVNGDIAGIILYSELNIKTAVIHFELIDPKYDGLAAYLNNLLGKKLSGTYKYINREQDLGLEGLRRSKLSYRPYRLLKKYNLSL